MSVDLLVAKLFWAFAIGIAVMLSLCAWFFWVALHAHGGVAELVGEFADNVEVNEDVEVHDSE